MKDQGVIYSTNPWKGKKEEATIALKEASDNEWALFGPSFKETGKKAYSHTQYDKKSLNFRETY